MKTISKFRMILVLLVVAFSSSTYASSILPVTPTETTTDAAKTEVLLNRLNEIKNMDKSNLTRADKKELRKEIKAIKKSMKASNKGVYLSVGAIIIIILLLILIL